MLRIMTLVIALTALVSCGDGQPFTFGNTTDDPVIDDPTDVNGIPESVAGNLQFLSYDPFFHTLEVEITSLDVPAPNPMYNRDARLDLPGYEAYSYQDDPLDRMFIAFVAQSNDGELIGGVVMDGGQFNKFFGGSYFERNGPYSNATANGGLVSYAGTYVGITNIDAPGNELLPVDPGTDPDILPSQGTRVTGDIFINADFNDNTINGAISNRVLVDYAQAIPTVYLIPTDISSEGTYAGVVENPAQIVIGSYAGTFGGIGATSTAGGIHLDGDFVPGVVNEEEYGVFVLTQCGQAGDAAICDAVNP